MCSGSVFQNCSLPLFLCSFGRVVNTANVTVLKRVDARGKPTKPCAISHAKKLAADSTLLNLHWRAKISSDDSGRCRANHDPGEVGMGFRPFANSSWANRTEKSFAWDSSMPTCAQDLS